jgi:hypothetical protein
MRLAVNVYHAHKCVECREEFECSERGCDELFFYMCDECQEEAR